MKEKVYLFVIFIAIEIVSAYHLRYIFYNFYLWGVNMNEP